MATTQGLNTLKKYFVVLLALAIISMMYQLQYQNTLLFQKATQSPSNKEKIRNITHNNRYPVTIVTCYFQLRSNKSKHQNAEYDKWINNWLPFIKYPVVIYTNQVEYISNIRYSDTLHPSLIINISFSELFIYKTYYESIYIRHYNVLDLKQWKHSPELYVIWNSKAWFLNQVSNVMNPFHSTYFIWVDIGSFRDPFNANLVKQNGFWPNVDQIISSLNKCRGEFCVLLGLVGDFKTSRKYKQRHKGKCPVFRNDEAHIQAAFMLGTKQSLNWWYAQFMHTHDLFIRKEIFVGVEQMIMNFIVINHSGDNILVLNVSNLGFYESASCLQNKWFYFQYFFADLNETTNKCRNITGPQPVTINGSQVKLYYKQTFPSCRWLLSSLPKQMLP